MSESFSSYNNDNNDNNDNNNNKPSISISTNPDLISKLLKLASPDPSLVVSVLMAENDRTTFTLEFTSNDVAYAAASHLTGTIVNGRVVRATVGGVDVPVDYRREAGERSVLTGRGTDGLIGDDEWAEIVVNEFMCREENSDLDDEELEKAFDKYMERLDEESDKKGRVERAMMQDYDSQAHTQAHTQANTQAQAQAHTHEEIILADNDNDNHNHYHNDFLGKFGEVDLMNPAEKAFTFEDEIAGGEEDSSPGNSIFTPPLPSEPLSGSELGRMSESKKSWYLATQAMSEGERAEREAEHEREFTRKLDMLHDWTDELNGVGDMDDDGDGDKDKDESNEQNYWMDDYQKAKDKELEEEMAARVEQDKNWDKVSMGAETEIETETETDIELS